jgi:hypothetical protein
MPLHEARLQSLIFIAEHQPSIIANSHRIITSAAASKQNDTAPRRMVPPIVDGRIPTLEEETTCHALA